MAFYSVIYEILLKILHWRFLAFILQVGLREFAVYFKLNSRFRIQTHAFLIPKFICDLQAYRIILSLLTRLQNFRLGLSVESLGSVGRDPFPKQLQGTMLVTRDTVVISGM